MNPTSNWVSRALNGFLKLFDLRLSRASSFDKLLSELHRQHRQLEEAHAGAGSVAAATNATPETSAAVWVDSDGADDASDAAPDGTPGAATHSNASPNAPPFETFVHRAPPDWDHTTVEPPVRPRFRSRFGGLWTDLNNADVILSGKLATGALSQEEADLVARWRRDGFVILRGAVDHAAIDAALIDFEQAYDGTIKRRMSYWDETGHHIDPASRDLLLKIDAKLRDLHDVSEATQAIQFAQPINRFLQIVFERPALAFQSLGFYYGSQQHVHQDIAFVRVSSPLEFVASWIALEDVPEGSGELEYYVGSHALPEYLFGGKYPWVQPGDPEVELFAGRLEARAKAAGLRKQSFLAKKGDALIWAAGLMHGGSKVAPPLRTRKSLVTHYCPADLQPMYAYKGGRPKRKAAGGNYVMGEAWD